MEGIENKGEITKRQEAPMVLYQSEGENISVSMMYFNETFWMPQKAMSELFDVGIPAINKHLKNIFADEELEESMVVSKMEITTPHGAIEGKTQSRETKIYNLDAIIAVGYRINSKKATKFRQWATQTLKEYITKGFVLNDDLLKNGRPFGKDYFDELLERIREIRASERRAYQKITDIFEQCSYDYDKNDSRTHDFYAFVQNKLHYAITGKTAAEIIYDRVDAEKPSMGLTSWKGSPNKKILKSDVTIAKNYYDEKELRKLNRLVTMFIDHAELMAEDNMLMSMQDWIDQMDYFLRVNRREVLEGKGKISMRQAENKAWENYAVFREKQDKEYMSDFDKEVKKLKK